MAQSVAQFIGLVCACSVVALPVIALQACGDEPNPKGTTDRPIVDADVHAPNYPGIFVAVGGNYLFEDSSTLQFRASHQDLPIRAVTPSWAILDLPTDATSTVLEVTHSGDAAKARVNMALEAQLPERHFLEEEPNDTSDAAVLTSLRFESRAVILAVAVAVEGTGTSLDLFPLDLPPREDYEDRLAVRVDQSSHGGDLAMTVAVDNANGASLASVTGATGEDVHLLVPLNGTRATYEVSVSAATGSREQRYDLEAEIIRVARRPERPFVAARHDGPSGLPTPYQGALDLGCDWPTLVDVDADGLNDIVCGDVFRSLGDGTFALDAETLELRGSQTWWRDFDADGQLDVLLVGPGPRTHHLYLRVGSQLVDRTAEAGLGAVTGTELLTVHPTDIDTDGAIDLIFVPHVGSPSVFRNVSGQFEAWTPWETTPFGPGERPTASVVFDADGDGDDDWLLFHVPESGGPAIPHRLENRGGTFEKRMVSQEGWQVHGARALTAAYIDDDEHLDLVLASNRGVEVHPGLGGVTPGGFGQPTLVSSAATVRGVAVDDVNTDGAVDIMVFANQGAELWLGAGLTFTPWRVAPGLPRGIGLPWTLVEPYGDGRRTLLIQGTRYDLTASPGHFLTVRVREGGGIAWGAMVTATQGTESQRRLVGPAGTNVLSPAPEARFDFLEDVPVELDIRYSDGTSRRELVESLDAVVEVVR